MKPSSFPLLVYGVALVLGWDHEALGRKGESVKIVETSSGPVTGHTACKSPGCVVEYLGIPYAQPPVGDLRFAKPVRYSGTSSINGTDFGFSCPAILTGAGSNTTLDFAYANLTAAGLEIISDIGQSTERFSEDCLTLNVWVPGRGEPKKVVMVWIYGGSFTSGSTAIAMYNGRNLASKGDVIVVSINYRLNIFGFPGNPSIPNLNLGLLDQRLAIEWLRDNIAAFGGDPSRITIFGQSAGGSSVDFYSYAYTSDPIVAGFIQESGTVVGQGTVNASTANAAWFNVTAALGCGSSSSNSSEVLTCMRTKSVDAILNEISQGPADVTISSPFNPAVDDITVFSDYPERSIAGKFIKAPLLIGSTDYEAGLFAAVDALFRITYPRAIWDEYDLDAFTCPAGLRANVNIAAHVPTWRYRYFGVFPNLRLTSEPESGAWHGSELSLIFETAPQGAGIPENTNEEISIGDYVREAWVTFAKDPANGLRNYQDGWPLYDPSEKTLIRLGYDNLTGVNLAMPSLYDRGCETTFAYL